MKKFYLTILCCVTVTALALAGNNVVENLAPTGDLGPLVTALENARLYPVFVLPMGPGYHDFELKASITNFGSNIPNASIQQQMVYWYATAVDNTLTNGSNPVWDNQAHVYFTTSATFYSYRFNSNLTDGRAWYPIPANESPSSFSSGVINQIVVIPSKIAGSATWMYKGNTNLVWSYCRINAVGTEKNPTGNTIWNPIVPVDWRSQQINP